MKAQYHIGGKIANIFFRQKFRQNIRLMAKQRQGKGLRLGVADTTSRQCLERAVALAPLFQTRGRE